MNAKMRFLGYFILNTYLYSEYILFNRKQLSNHTLSVKSHSDNQLDVNIVQNGNTPGIS